MIRSAVQDSSHLVRALCLLAAALLWLSVIVERPAETRLRVPVYAVGAPPGAKVVVDPATVDVVVTGPKILLWLLPYRAVTCGVFVGGTPAVTRKIDLREDSILLPDRDLKVVQVIPASVAVTVSAR